MTSRASRASRIPRFPGPTYPPGNVDQGWVDLKRIVPIKDRKRIKQEEGNEK